MSKTKKEPTITAYIISEKPNQSGKIQMENSLEGFYKALECDNVEILTRAIGGEYYDLIIDGEGRLKERPATAYAGDFLEDIKGPAIIAKYEGDGEEHSLTPEDLERIEKNATETEAGKRILGYRIHATPGRYWIRKLYGFSLRTLAETNKLPEAKQIYKHAVEAAEATASESVPYMVFLVDAIEEKTIEETTREPKQWKA